MSENNNQKNRPIMTFKTAKAANYSEVYANQTRFGMSPWDISITFGLLKENDGSGVAIEDIVQMRLSPHTFKSLALTLPHFMEAYERSFGEVNLPEHAVLSGDQIRDITNADTSPPPPLKPSRHD